MPLSDREKKLLAEMEAALEQDDPRLVSALTGKVRTPARSRAVGGTIAVFVGMAILLGGLVAQITLVGIAGFLIALVGAFIAISNFKPGGEFAAYKDSKTPKQPKRGWSARLEDRWDRRNYEG